MKQPPQPAASRTRPYADAVADFSVEAALETISRGGNDILNPAIICCDRHCGAGRAALTWIGEDGSERIFTFEELRDRSIRFAQFLRRHHIAPGDRVACLLPRIPELLVTMLGTFRAGCVYQPLFTAFGPKAIEHRLRTSGAKLIVTDAANRPKLDGLADPVAIMTVGDEGITASIGDLNFGKELDRQDSAFEPVARRLDDPFLIMFTSGTTGPAKPVLVPIKALAAFIGYMRDVAGLHASQRYWNIADPGWAYGLYYGVLGALAAGHRILFYDGSFSVAALVRIVADYGVTNLAGSPTAFRQLMAAGPNAVSAIKGQLEAVSSCGEPLNPEVIRWAADQLGTTIHDHYGQTEIGIVLGNHHALDHPVQPGAAGFAVPGHRVVVLDDDGRELPPNVPGELAIDQTASPLFWFSGYEGAATASLGPRYYRSGDTVELNTDGSISFVGRADDVITSSGYRIGPFDVESALIEHPAVAEAAAIGKPDPVRTEIVKAFIVLRAGHQPSTHLADELRTHVRQRLSAHAYPREIEFVKDLPKTPSGKIQRFVLRNGEITKQAK